MKYKCQQCDEIHDDSEVSLKCCEYAKKTKIVKWKCNNCQATFEDERYALACCREKKVKPYQPKGVWNKIESLDDIPKDLKLFGTDGEGDMWLFEPIHDRIDLFDIGDYYMIPIMVPVDDEDDGYCEEYGYTF